MVAAIPEMLAGARQSHQAGNLADAERGYREILSVQPTCGEAWHLLSGIAQQRCDYAEAAECLERAVVLMPQSATAYSDLGTALLSLGRFDEAVAALRRAVQLAPDAAVL